MIWRIGLDGAETMADLVPYISSSLDPYAAKARLTPGRPTIRRTAYGGEAAAYCAGRIL